MTDRSVTEAITDQSMSDHATPIVNQSVATTQNGVKITSKST